MEGMAYLPPVTFCPLPSSPFRTHESGSLSHINKANVTEYYSDINWVIMDYLVSEGYPGAAEKFAQETNLCQPADIEGIRERVRIRNAIHAGKIDEAVGLVNEVDPEVSNQTLYTSSRNDYTSVFMHHSYPPTFLAGVDEAKLTFSPQYDPQYSLQLHSYLTQLLKRQLTLVSELDPRLQSAATLPTSTVASDRNNPDHLGQTFFATSTCAGLSSSN